MSSGDGSRRSSLRPDNIRCHARGVAPWAPVLALIFAILLPAPLPTLPRSRGRVGRGAPAGRNRLYVAAFVTTSRVNVRASLPSRPQDSQEVARPFPFPARL